MSLRTHSAALLTCAIALLAVTLPARAADSIEATIRALEQQQVRAAITRDRATLEKLFAPDHMMANPPGALVTREALFKVLVGGPAPYKSATYETQLVRVLGDDAVLTSGVETVVPNSGPTAGQTVRRRTTQVWKRAGDSWQLTYRHASIITAP